MIIFCIFIFLQHIQIPDLIKFLPKNLEHITEGVVLLRCYV